MYRFQLKSCFKNENETVGLNKSLIKVRQDITVNNNFIGSNKLWHRKGT